jgi:ribosomal peptide maturation radical SAM protein 1
VERVIHLVSMPFASVVHPTLALGVMKSQLARENIASEVAHFNLDFARMIGAGAYETIALFKGVETQVGEWLFACEAWDRHFGPSEEDFLRLSGEELTNIPHVTDRAAWLRKVRHEVVPAFLDACVARLAARGEPRVVAFSCTFFQTVASLALGRRLRARFPSVKLVYGGACFHDEMGEELMRAVPFLDAVSTGEADDVIVPLFRAMLEGRAPEGLQGVLWRDEPGGPVRHGAPHRPVAASVLDGLPDPDFDDFFRQAERVGFARDASWQERVFLPFESARGCWWGQKQHCTFCGLNAGGMDFRARSADRVYDALKHLARRYPAVKNYQAADNILSMKYFHDLLPRMADDPPAPGVELFWSVKANMRRAQVKAMADAGIRSVQPGIESLSDNLLVRMRKGVTALQNIYFMKCCREQGIAVYWNNLIRMPGETRDDYARMTAWFPKLTHLRPPYGGSPAVECHRFSPYHFETHRWASARRPMAWYGGLFPSDTVDLAKVAFYFDADWSDVLGGSSYDAMLRVTSEWTRLWRESPATPRCEVVERLADGGARVLDSRDGVEKLVTLSPRTARVLAALDAPTTLARLTDTLAREMDASALRAELDALVTAGFVLGTEEGDLVSLVLAEGTPDVALTTRNRRLRRVNNQRPREEPAPATAGDASHEDRRRHLPLARAERSGPHD